MTTGIQCRADPQHKVPAPPAASICFRHAKQAKKAGVAVPKLSLAGQLKRTPSPEPQKELEP